MKKFLGYAAAVALACPISFAIPTAASADTTGRGNSGNAAECQQLAASVGFSQGDCVAFLNGNITANALCTQFLRLDPADFNAEFSNFGACVKFANTLLPF